eukprot:snap_masked-scaffold_4-processed-gene-2.26-mRNA-1 protein AED:1.00 eAED:1.00 QI:0/0/0/0/1/1/2/0/84
MSKKSCLTVSFPANIWIWLLGFVWFLKELFPISVFPWVSDLEKAEANEGKIVVNGEEAQLGFAESFNILFGQGCGGMDRFQQAA